VSCVPSHTIFQTNSDVLPNCRKNCFIGNIKYYINDKEEKHIKNEKIVNNKTKMSDEIPQKNEYA
jgi:hypothetical protein